MTSSLKLVRVHLSGVTTPADLVAVLEKLRTFGELRRHEFSFDRAGHGSVTVSTSATHKTLEQALAEVKPDMNTGIEDLTEENGHDQPAMA